MKHRDRWMIGTLLCVSLQLAACAQPGGAAEEEDPPPAKVEHLDGPEPTRVTLTADAAQRLAIETAPVRQAMMNGRLRMVIPYAAILYDTEGATWTYASPESLVFVRHRIEVDYIEGDLAVLTQGPTAGTAVVTVGAQELYGSELEFEEE